MATAAEIEGAASLLHPAPAPQEQVVGSLSGKAAEWLSKTWLNPDNASCSENCLIRTAGKVVRGVLRLAIGGAVGLGCGLVGVVINPARVVWNLGAAFLYSLISCCKSGEGNEYDYKASEALHDAGIAFCGIFGDLLRISILGTAIFAITFSVKPDVFKENLKPYQMPPDLLVTGLIFALFLN